MRDTQALFSSHTGENMPLCKKSPEQPGVNNNYRGEQKHPIYTAKPQHRHTSTKKGLHNHCTEDIQKTLKFVWQGTNNFL